MIILSLYHYEASSSWFLMVFSIEILYVLVSWTQFRKLMTYVGWRSTVLTRKFETFMLLSSLILESLLAVISGKKSQ